MAQLREDEWPRDREATTPEQQVAAFPADEHAPVIGNAPLPPTNAERERRSITREPKQRATDEGRDRTESGADDGRRRTRDGATSGEWQSGVADD